MEKWSEKKANGRRLFTKLVALGLAIGIIAISTLSGILGTWKIANGAPDVFRHRILVACGALDRVGIEQEWKNFQNP